MKVAVQVGEHTHYIEKGVLAKMAELDDSPATCEKYPFEGEAQGEVSMTWGVSGMAYVYLAQLDHVFVYPTLDMLMAGGVV